jgi:hypothetical protein
VEEEKNGQTQASQASEANSMAEACKEKVTHPAIILRWDWFPCYRVLSEDSFSILDFPSTQWGAAALDLKR